MIITVFEDQNYKSLFPLNLNRASFELRCGAFTNLERIQNLLGEDDSVQLVVREELVPLLMERYPNITVNPHTLSAGLWLNGRGLWTETILNEIKNHSDSETVNIICSASPEDYISLVARAMNWDYLCSTLVDGNFLHMHKEQKILSVLENYDKSIYDYNFSISDSKNDLDLLKMFNEFRLINISK